MKKSKTMTAIRKVLAALWMSAVALSCAKSDVTIPPKQAAPSIEATWKIESYAFEGKKEDLPECAAKGIYTFGALKDGKGSFSFSAECDPVAKGSYILSGVDLKAFRANGASVLKGTVSFADNGNRLTIASTFETYVLRK